MELPIEFIEIMSEDRITIYSLHKQIQVLEKELKECKQKLEMHALKESGFVAEKREEN